ncbi:epoxide hydrolase family protein [Microbulbifer sp. JMSA008]|jgi:pimeloyl-ACP methyl ester carboxylesterase|uniref:epoxide hydrolase family protein n=1 Tax=unclassified Microbulbifer TaxID=2619833 RepID=UPI00403AD7FA
MAQVQPFRIDIQESQLADMHRRIREARWPEAETVDGWAQGIPLNYLKDFCDYWLNDYDWYATQQRLNQYDQFITTIHDLEIHLIHVKSSHRSATPIVITHGWPSSFVEFLKVIGPLTEPTQYGGSAEEAFHVVCPSLPGFAFSGKPVTTGWGIPRIAAAWDTLMHRLGYQSYLAQGGDWGRSVTTEIGIQNLGACRAIHINNPKEEPTAEALHWPSEEEKEALAGIRFFNCWDSGFAKEQSTRPQTLGYSLADSPIGQAAWILEKFHLWSNCQGTLESIFTRNELLDNIMLYWLTNTAASSARLFWESFDAPYGPDQEKVVQLPTGVSIYPGEMVRIPRSWAEGRYKNICYWNHLKRGGHFSAFEQPELYVEEIRAWKRSLQ